MTADRLNVSTTGPAPATTRLIVSKASKGFSGLQALTDVDLQLGEGEVLGLIGPNGSGKTTLMNVISGALRPTAGRVTIGETDVTGWDAHRVARRGVARTFQNIRLFGDLTVLENVEVGLTARPRRDRSSPRARARAVLAEIGVEHLEVRIASTLSYGQQRSVELARALAASPRFLLLDEPAAGMNPQESHDLMLTLRRLTQRHRHGLLVVDHDLSLIMGLCDRIQVLNEGRTIARGRPEEVREDPTFVEAYLGVRRERTWLKRRGSTMAEHQAEERRRD